MFSLTSLDPTTHQVIFNKEYETLVRKAPAGSIFRFSDGREFVIGEGKWFGGMTWVIELAHPPSVAKADAADRVLRIPLKAGLDERGASIPKYIDYTYQGALSLNALDGVAVHAELDLYLPGQYIVVEKIENPISLTHFLLQTWEDDFAKRGIRLTEAQVRNGNKLMLNTLIEWAKKTALIGHIPDWKTDQLAFDLKHKQWKLLDWTGPPIPVTENNLKSNLFTVHWDARTQKPEVNFSPLFKQALEPGKLELQAADARVQWFLPYLQKIQKEIQTVRLTAHPEWRAGNVNIDCGVNTTKLSGILNGLTKNSRKKPKG